MKALSAELNFACDGRYKQRHVEDINDDLRRIN